MLTVYLHDKAQSLTFRLIGELSGGDAAEVEQAWKTAAPTLGERDLVIDLSEVSSLDEDARVSLRRLAAQGARFITGSVLTDSAAAEVSGREPAQLPAAPAGVWRRLACSLMGCCRRAGSALHLRLPCAQRIRRVW